MQSDQGMANSAAEQLPTAFLGGGYIWHDREAAVKNEGKQNADKKIYIKKIYKYTER